MGKDIVCDRCGKKVGHANNFTEFCWHLFTTLFSKSGFCENCRIEKAREDNEKQKRRDELDQKEVEARRLGRADEEGRLEARRDGRRW